ncbi:cell division protein FtsW [Candidatus Woesebacteria bacterium RIFCSPHIGHO2_01_FULL_39_32]|uniref:Probable peptidoglycan glycosyltransferase FtsW n=1 Tax=Candidatus Woesebacteria bacterium RIFCSPLOWO2_01_FULL_39_25 TaxID=1802521 RepID=A0A1F8BMS6_9BACT|nr:MAG: cell division protein FtsW [Candidatus Woesebacteria bacterium GWB1_37_5]OGM25438.1 MAG: cell division protein FtsW [Candidatus Woesebacteria bacterium RIFCSPHIGHO2_01_FULL_39_32]OGM38543.1 MAG: cell division protein FtsW [Candidatus Woesebacteria bacterium RIFCSPHIGHO2_12_FULL_38_11]OGM64969.1 MAG: cell division protein FtsW [Candidatus Woesebacteria bacterium RIFCSPLOWO2_01_FULL_39_25]
MRKNKLQRQASTIDKKFLLLSLFLTVVGLVALADASAPLAQRNFGDKFFFLKQQIVWAGVGIVLLFIASKIHYRLWEKIATIIFFLSLFGMLMVFIPGIGTKLLGARRWLVLGPITIQPSEFLKLTLAIYLAKVSSKNKKLAAYFVPLILALSLIMLQPDLGTAIVVSTIGMAQLFVSGISLIYFASTLALGGVLGFILIITSEYRRDRLLTFFEQTRDPLDKSYHIRQILLALGSGGLFGVGLGQSRQKYLFLPETATDSIFAIIAEEIGFLGASILIIIIVIFVIRGFAIARASPDTFSRVLSCGIMSWIGAQTLLNIGSMVAIVPLTGIPLPFFSYGGSSLIALLIGCGILLNISKYGKE